MPKTEKIVKKRNPVSKEDKKEVLDAIVVDMLADKLPDEQQKELPDGGVLITQTLGETVAIKTDVVSELPKAGMVVTSEISEKEVESEKKNIAEAIGSINIAEPILEHTTPNKAEHASEALNFLSDQLKEEADILIQGNRLIIAKALLMASHILKTSSKTVKFFSKFKKKGKR